MADEQTNGNRLPIEWRRWAAVALMKGAPLAEVLGMLRDQGFPEGDAIRYTASLFDDPALDAGRWLAQQLQKVNSVLTMRETMRALSDVPLEVERRTGVSQKEFLDRYYSQNTPVLMTDSCDRWPAQSLWDADYLVGKLGSTEVEVMAGRESDPDYEINANQHRFMMPFDEYWARSSPSPAVTTPISSPTTSCWRRRRRCRCGMTSPWTSGTWHPTRSGPMPSCGSARPGPSRRSTTTASTCCSIRLMGGSTSSWYRPWKSTVSTTTSPSTAKWTR